MDEKYIKRRILSIEAFFLFFLSDQSKHSLLNETHVLTRTIVLLTLYLTYLSK